MKEKIEIYKNQSPKALEALQISYSNYKRDYENVGKIDKYRNGEMTHYTDVTTGIVWHNGKFVEQLKQENEELKELLKQLSADEHQQLLLELYKNRQKFKKIKAYIENMLKCSTGHTQTYYDILTIIEEE